MKNFYCILLFLATGICCAKAQSPDWIWAKSAGLTGNDEGVSVSTDAIGNVLVTGFFKSHDITFGTTTLVNSGPNASSDIFIVKYDAQGNLLWAKRAGGHYDDRVTGTFDIDGNILITGGFYSAISFGTITLYGTGVTYEEMFVAKYDGAGNILWANSAGQINTSNGIDITTDMNGNVLVTGAFTGPSITFGTTLLVNYGQGNMFLVKYDPSGNVLWAKKAGANVYESGTAVSTDSNGNVFVAGFFTSTSFNFGIGQTYLYNSGSEDLFIAKFDSSGTYLWAQAAGGINNENISDLSIDGNGDAIITGSFSSPAFTMGNTTLTTLFSSVLVAKYDPSGNVIWAKSSDGLQPATSQALTVDASDNILLTGFFYTPDVTFDTITLTNTGSINTFIVKYNTSGNVLWAKSTGGTQSDGGNGIATDANGNVLVTGYFSNADITLGTTTLTNSGDADIYVAKLDSTGFTALPDENITSDVITVFPNPTYGQFTISSSENIDEIIITNVAGQVVYEANPGAAYVNLQLESSGMYFVQIISKKQTVTKKIIVSRN